MNDLDRKILWKCRRGMLELDVIFSRFYQEKMSQLTSAEKMIFNSLLDEPDPVLASWIMGSCPPENPQFRNFINQWFKIKI
jgi:antitoxin CptB